MTGAQEIVHDIATGVVMEVWRRYRGYVEADDLRQEVELWRLANPTKVSEYLALEDRDRNAVVATAVRHRLRRFAEREKASALGYSTRDVAWYTQAQVRDLLPSLFDPDDWSNPPQPERGSPRANQDPAHGGNWLASLADVAAAFARLDAEVQNLVRAKYEYEWTNTRIAEHLGISDTTVADRLDRAVARMHELLGGDKPEHHDDEITLGRRRVISNSHAQAMTGRDFSGE